VTSLFRQADFIEQSLNNLFISPGRCRLVILVVVLFLMNGRAALLLADLPLP
jgi:Cu/Ag efflux pump CusA